MKIKELFGEDWYDFLQPFLESKDFKKISKELLRELELGKMITPEFDNTFRAFKECPFDKLSVVIIGQDPYPGINPDKSFVADGIAFSSRTAKKCPVSLDLIYKAIAEDLFEGDKRDLYNTFDLTKWSNQGILLLNSALTYPIKEDSGSHYELWKPFITYLLQKLIGTGKYMSYIHFGKMAQSYINITGKLKCVQVLQANHPASAKYSGGKWNHNQVFKACSGYQNFLVNKIINW